MSVEEIQDLNRSLQNKVKPVKRGRKESKNPLESINALHSALDAKIRQEPNASHRASAEANNKVLKFQRIINAFTHHNRGSQFSGSPGKEDLLKIFTKLAGLKVNSDLLKSCALMKVLKLFARESENSGNKDIEVFGDVAALLVANWEKVCLLEDNLSFNTDQVEDSTLRKKGSKQICKILTDKGFSKPKGMKLANRCETSIWNQSKGFANGYKNALTSLLGQLAESHQAEIESIIDKLKDQS